MQFSAYRGKILMNQQTSRRRAPVTLAMLAVLALFAPCAMKAVSLSGTVTGRLTAERAQYFRVHVLDPETGQEVDSGSGFNGSFRIDLSPFFRPGTYTLRVTGSDFVDQLLGGAVCQATETNYCSNLAEGTTFEVTENGDIADLNFAVDFLGVISGRVIGADDRPARVTLYSSATLEYVAERGLEDGAYTFRGLEPGGYLLVVSDRLIIDEVFNDIRCIPGSSPCDNLASGTPVIVGLNETRDGIDFIVKRTGSISGTVYDRATDAPVPLVRVFLWNSGDTSASIARMDTDAAGRYGIDGLNPGFYFATVASVVYNDQLYDGLECPEAGLHSELCDITDGTPIAVLAESDTSVDFRLRKKARITGRVLDHATGGPLRVSDGSPRPTVDVRSADGRHGFTAEVAEDGSYEAEGLVEGTYFAEAQADFYLAEIYDDIPCGLFVLPCFGRAFGTPILVKENRTRSGIDFELDRLGTISGRVTSAATGEPIPGAIISVEIRTLEGALVTTASVDPTGYYHAGTTRGIAPGAYYATVDTLDDLLGEVWGGEHCHLGERGCDLSTGRPITVRVGSDTPGIDFALERGATIEGRVTHALTGEPLQVHILVSDDQRQVRNHETNADGRYSISKLPPGEYFVSARSSDYQNQVYPNTPCPRRDCEGSLGQPISVAFSGLVRDVDFRLHTLSTISGRVAPADPKLSVYGAAIEFWTAAGPPVTAYAETSPDGSYEVTSYPGVHYAVAYPLTEFRRSDLRLLPKIYEDTTCSGEIFPCITTGTGIPVELDSAIENVDFDFDSAGTVSGRVVDRATGKPLKATVSLFAPDGALRGFGVTDDDGYYRTTGGHGPTYPGSYFARAYARDSVRQLYPGVECSGSEFVSCDRDQGTTVPVATGADQSGIDFALDPGGSIAVDVVDGLTGKSLSRGAVWAFDARGNRLAEAQVLDIGGANAVRNLPPSNYYLTVEYPGRTDLLYPNIPCPESNCNVTRGKPIAVSPGEQVEGITFEMGPPMTCDPDKELCLQNEDFVVTVDWRDADGNTGHGHPRPFGDTSGLFSFFGPENLEVFVKVLDACHSPFHSYFIFAAGLTNLEVSLEVTPRRTPGRQPWITTSPLGKPFEPILDIHALPEACGYSSAASSREFTPSLDDLAALLSERSVGASEGDCVPNATTLCLGRGRFQVEASWRDSQGERGEAVGIPLTRDTGSFTFFSADNLEVLLKVIDGCSITGHYWVFAGGLTNLAVTLTVTDLHTGAVQQYLNPLGVAFKPIQDTSAFRCDASL